MRSCSGFSPKFLCFGWLVVTTPLHAQIQSAPADHEPSQQLHRQTATTPVDAAAARQLFEEARQLVKKGHYADACPKFEQSYRRDPGIGTLYNLADCWEHLGRTASAWAKFRDVADEAARTNQREREQVALKRADALLLQLSKVVVRVESRDEGLQIQRDGVPMAHSDVGRPIPLDPGEHWFEATAPGKRPWRASVKVPPRGNAIEVVVPALGDDTRPSTIPALSVPLAPGGSTHQGPNSEAAPLTPPTTAAGIAPSPAASAGIAPSPAATSSPVATGGTATATMDPSRSDSGQRTWAYVAGGVGLVAIASGTYFGLRVRSKNEDIDSLCPAKPCPAQDFVEYDNARQDARNARTLALIGFGVGGAALATATVLFFTAPKSKPSAWQMTPALALDSLGAQLQGAF